jgi:hypothetical protein
MGSGPGASGATRFFERQRIINGATMAGSPNTSGGSAFLRCHAWSVSIVQAADRPGPRAHRLRCVRGRGAQPVSTVDAATKAAGTPTKGHANGTFSTASIRPGQHQKFPWNITRTRTLTQTSKA